MKTLWIAIVLAAGAGAADAEVSARDKDRLSDAAFAPRPPVDKDVRIPGVARTAVDYRAGGGLVGSLGFLCGREPGADLKGAAAAHGYDPNGRFVGAKLRIAFR